MASPTNNSPRPTILVVDDNPSIRRLVRKILSENGYFVLEASDGVEALHVAERYRATIHMLLTDLEMPRMGGLQLAKTLQSVRPDMVTLYMSGVRSLPLNMLIQGVFIQKPFKSSDLLTQVEIVLSRRQETVLAAQPIPASLPETQAAL